MRPSHRMSVLLSVDAARKQEEKVRNNWLCAAGCGGGGRRAVQVDHDGEPSLRDGAPRVDGSQGAARPPPGCRSWTRTREFEPLAGIGAPELALPPLSHRGKFGAKTEMSPGFGGSTAGLQEGRLCSGFPDKWNTRGKPEVI